jgi:hypothetical protein
MKHADRAHRKHKPMSAVKYVTVLNNGKSGKLHHVNPSIRLLPLPTAQQCTHYQIVQAAASPTPVLQHLSENECTTADCTSCQHYDQSIDTRNWLLQ